MDHRFNMYSRTEEEKTEDMILYEKKARAVEICEKYGRLKKKADIATAVAVAITAAAGFPFFFYSYDNELIWGMGLYLVGVVLIALTARFATGAFLARSLPVFVKWGSLSSKLKAARSEMHELEAKFADQTVFEDDMKKAQKRLMDSCEAIIAFAEKYGITE